MLARTGMALVAAFTLGVTPAPGQRVLGRVTLSAGSATDTRGVRTGAWTAAPGLVLTGASVVLTSGARYSRYADEHWAAGGGANLLAAISLASPLALRVAGSAEYTRTSYRDGFTIAEGTPTLHARLGPAEGFAGVKGAAARTSFDLGSPGGPLIPPVTQREVVNRTAWGPVFGGTIRLVDAPRAALQLGYRQEMLRVEGARVTERVGTLAAAAGPATAGLRFGQQRGAGDDRTFGGARLAVTLTPVIALAGTAESYAVNPMTGALGGRTVGAGLVLTLGGRSRQAAFPRPPGVAPPVPGFTRLSLRNRAALRVELAGDWNNWVPKAMQRGQDGIWYQDVELPPGAYRYAFRIDGDRWTVPRGAAAVDDGFGGKSAWLTVPVADQM